MSKSFALRGSDMRRLDGAGARVIEVPMRKSPEGEHIGRGTKFNRRQ